MPVETNKKKQISGNLKTWTTIAILSVVWWVVASLASWQRGVLLIWLSLGSLMVGALAGFLFSMYGEEEASGLGKIRDWLVGGITTLTIVKAGSIKGLLLVFAAGPGPIEFAFTAAAATVYAGLGFFFMFFERELIFNVLLARSRAERGRLEGTQQAIDVIQQFHVRLSASLLTGINYVDDIPDMSAKEREDLRSRLYDSDVDTFLEQADERADSGRLDWDIASKAAYIHYYRTYFEKDASNQREKALEWILCALNMNPLHADLTMKYADLLGGNEEYEATVAILERLALRPEAPVLVKQWLGYYLRFVPDRLDDAIRYSQKYHELLPDESDTFFNIAYAYARKYCNELSKAGHSENLRSSNRSKALTNLKEGLREQPSTIETVRKWMEKGKPFECLKDDKEFRLLVTPKEAVAAAAAASTK